MRRLSLLAVILAALMTVALTWPDFQRSHCGTALARNFDFNSTATRSYDWGSGQRFAVSSDASVWELPVDSLLHSFRIVLDSATNGAPFFFLSTAGTNTLLRCTITSGNTACDNLDTQVLIAAGTGISLRVTIGGNTNPITEMRASVCIAEGSGG